MNAPFSKRWFFCAFGAVFVVFVILGMCLAVMRASDGHLIFPLDDPYIHLAVAETILEGGYGVNLEETAAPSSSILFPFLLTVGLLAGFGGVSALAFNIPAAAFTAALVADQIWMRAVKAGPKISAPVAYGLLALAILGLNIPGLALTGMEHSLHVLASLCAVLGLLRLYEGQGGTWMLTAGVVLGPLLRFEGIALSLAAMAVVFLFGHRRIVFWQFTLLTLGLGAWLLWASVMGLTVLPSSVLSKSAVSAAAHERDWWIVAMNAAERLRAAVGHSKTGSLILVPMVAAVFMIWRDRKLALVGVPVVLACIAHATFGLIGHWNRYEIYAVTIAAAIVFYGFAVRMGEQAQHGRLKFTGFALATALGFAVGFGDEFVRTPSASQNIYRQQVQMHRFATEYFPERVAVNDLGQVSYGNDAFVLDLWGLGSERVRALRTTKKGELSAEDIAMLTSEAGSTYAMIYNAWFGDSVPETWCKGAVLTVPQVVAGSDTVQFYLIDLSRAQDFNEALARFAPTLPEGADIDVSAC